MELILIRHAEPVKIVDATGPADPPLADRGTAQAERMADWLATEVIDGVWSSPMRRAQETAAPLSDRLGIEIVVDHELAEYDRDATSYIPIEELKAAKDERWLAMVEGNFESETGVDPKDFQAGVVRAIDHIASGNPGSRVAVVCHGGVINAYVGHVLGIERVLWFEPRYTSVTRVMASRHGDRTLVSLNETAHLRGSDLLA
ncbi:MAG: histidine phosphatase family protein [Acidimicrobiales bacterium]